MKRLSDYVDNDAIELWADLLDPISAILSDRQMAKVIQGNKNPIVIAKNLLKEHKDDVVTIMLRIDPTPIDGLNIVVRLVNILNEIGESEELKSFFGFSEQEETLKESSGSAMASTKAKKK